MFRGVKERMEVSIYSEIFGVLGPVIVMVALPVMVDSLGERIGSMDAWAWSAGAMCVIFGVACFIGGVLGAKERKEFSIEKHLPFIKSLKVVLQSRLLLMYLVVSIMLTCQITWLPAMFPFLIKYSLGMSLSQMSVVMGIELLGTFAFYPLWRMVAMRIGSKKTFIISVTLFTMGLMLVLVINGMLQTAAAALVMGIGISGCMPVIRVMNADIIDEDELKTGLRREGVIYGVLGALGKISIAISAGATGFVLVTLSGYVPGATEQSPFVGTGIRIGMATFGFIFWLLMMVALRFYPLSKEKVAEIEAKIKELHAEKAKRLEEGISKTETISS
jgi:GPH family glycoside/pentoside/hexuronide:cation symporter